MRVYHGDMQTIIVQSLTVPVFLKHRHKEVEHLVPDEDPNTALCGADKTDVPWNQGLPLCQACVAIDQGRMN